MKLIEISCFRGLDDSVRVSLNKWAGNRDAGGFTEMLDIADLKYACHNSPKRKSFSPGMTNLVFVKVGDNRLLFVAALRIDGESGPDGFCPYSDVTESLGMSGMAKRLIVSDSEPSKCKMGTWVFRANRLWDFEVESFDRTEWSGLEWNGYDKVQLSFGMLYDIIEGNRHTVFRTHLEDVCGVYALKDVKTGKLYIGSAYGEQGIAQRWNHYLDSGHGGNKLLKELYDREGLGYFKANFTFTLLRDFPLNTDKKRIIAFESMMKELFDTRTDGYNAN